MDRKITTYFLKLLRNKERCFIQELDNHYLVIDTYMMFKIPKDEFELNPSLFDGTIDCKKLIPNEEEYNDAMVVGYRAKLAGTGLIAELTDGKVECWVDTDRLKFFDGCTFKIKTNVSVVLCYKDRKFYGLVTPLRIIEKWWEFKGTQDERPITEVQ